MSGLLDLLNAVVGAALEEQSAGGAVTWRAVRLRDDGAELTGRVDGRELSGEFALRLDVSTSGPDQHGVDQYSVSVTVLRWPDRLPPALEPFRHLLERTRLRLDLDLSRNRS